jgi:hypothetical protein
VTDGHPKRIEGLKGGDLYNSNTKQIYGTEVFVQLLRKMPLRAMQFHSVKDGGGVADPNVPLNDDRCQWHGDEKPVATVFRDFLAVLLSADGKPANREVIALSFKSSGIKAAKALWGLAAMRNKPVFAGRYRITTGIELKPEMHNIYKVENAGWVSELDAKLGEEMYEAVQTIDATKIDHEVHDDDFPPVDGEVRDAPTDM